MKRFLCVHGHFYQPPRENPWLEAIETQDSAAPYHDWNERINVECYANNTASRILDKDNRIVDIVSNYAKISFDMGPTLLSWMEKNDPEVYKAIIEADKLSVSWRSGHGAAMAQAHNHMIMPLASPRDKLTQIIWGIRDFKHRFGRDPEGMWLPEAAVDLETLDIMASQGITFTVLAPNQAQKVRKIGDKEWFDVSDSKVDPKIPFICNLPSGKKINVFFYDGHISRAVAFERLLESGVEFAKRLMSGFSGADITQLMHIATDGESYGHHHRFGDMALSYALHHIENNNLARITNYGEFLEMNPPDHEVGIFENTSWSCVHGVERWKNDCGCSTGGKQGWDQKWRAPLRNAMDKLRDELAAGFEKEAGKLFKDPWAARDDYIDVILDRSDENIDRFLAKHSTKGIQQTTRITALKLMELQRHAMLMYTSCGWFFADISGIETVQVLQYAGRAIQLAREVLGVNLEPEFVPVLEKAKSNVPEQGNGARIYERYVSGTVLTLEKVAVHYAISSLFEDYGDEASIYCYDIKSQDYKKLHAGKSVLLTGRCQITSRITSESDNLSFSVLHLGNHDFNCGVRRFVSDKSYAEMTEEIHKTFETGAFSDVVRLLDTHFGMHSFSLKDLFRDERRAVLKTLMEETMEGFAATYRRMFEENRILMGFIKESAIPVPKEFLTAAGSVLTLDLKTNIMSDFDPEDVKEILREANVWNVELNREELEFTLKRVFDAKMKHIYKNPSDIEALKTMDRETGSALTMPFSHNFWLPQNLYYRMAKDVYTQYQNKMKDDKEAETWIKTFRSLGEKLNFNLDAVLPDK